MQNDPHQPDAGFVSRILPKPSLRHRRVLAMGTAATIIVVGLGAFAFLPPVRAIRTANTPVMVAANQSDSARAPRIARNCDVQPPLSAGRRSGSGR